MRKITLITAIILIIASLFMFVACDKQAPTTTSDLNTPADMDNINEANDVQGVFLSMNSEAISASDENPMQRRVVATVYPANAKDKSVTWSAAWGESENAVHSTENVLDYVTITCENDETNVAMITCIKSFGTTDSIIITATTNCGGYKASITCTYSGKAFKYTIDYTNAFWQEFVEEQYDPSNPLRSGSASRTVYQIDGNENVSSGIAFLDYFDNNAAKVNNCHLSINLVGDYTMGFFQTKREALSTDSRIVKWYDYTTVVTPNTKIIDIIGPDGKKSAAIDPDDETIANRTISEMFNLYSSVSEYYKNGTLWFPSLGGSFLETIFDSYIDDGCFYTTFGVMVGAANSADIYLPYFEVTLTCDDITVKFNVRTMNTTVYQVSLDTATIEF